MESERKGHKRKLAETLLESSSSSSSSSQQQQRQQSVGVACTSSSSTALLPQEVELQVSKLNSSFSWREADRLVARRAAHALAEFAKHEEHVDTVVNAGAIPALVQHLEAPPLGDEEGPIALEHEVEKEAALAIGLFAVKPEHQSVIADAGALTCLVSLLKRRGNGCNDRVVNSVLRRAADAITNLAHENCTIKSSIRTEGGILPLVDLLESSDVKVQRAAAAALRTLAFKNEANKHQIVECGALPILIFMLRSEDVGIHYEAVGVIGNLVHSSTNIKKEVLAAGALQPVIGLLSSRCQESQREAALLLGQFATAEPECKAHIVQRGAVRPLSKMLQSSDPQLKEMAAFALGRLAQDSHNQAGIVHDGGLVPLLELLSSKNGSLQHNAAFALYGLADNEDNISDIIKEGGVQKLQEVELIVQPSKDCVAKTLKRLEEKMKGRVLKHLVYLMRVSDKSVQRYVALSLAHLCSVSHQRMIFIENNGLEILLGLLDPSSSLKHQRYGAVALLTLAKRATTETPVDAALPPPTPQVYLGEKYVNSTVLSDVTFLVEGRRFHAHRIALLASSDAFRAMFDGGYRERDASDIEIPNISWDVFELMMRFIYTGTVEVTLMLAQNLLRAADQYLLEGLKRLCETCIGKNLTIENLANVLDLVESYHANTLGNMCALYFLEHHDQISNMPGYTTLVQRILPEIRDYLSRVLRP